MNVAMFSWKFPVVSETFVVNMITGLLDRGHNVDIFPLDKEGADISFMHQDVKNYNLLRRVYNLPDLIPNRFMLILKLLRLLAVHGYKEPFVALRYLNPLGYGKGNHKIGGAFKLLPLLGKRPYDIVHCQFGTIGLRFLSFRNHPKFQGKLIVSIRGSDITRFVRKHGNDVYKPLLVAGDLFLVNCDFFRRRLIRLGCDEKKIIIYRSGVDCSRFSFRPRRLGSDRTIRIMTTGRLVEKKGLEYGIRAVAKVIKQKRNVEFNIVGDGPLKGHLENLIKELGVQDRIKMLGAKTQHQIIVELERIHVFMATSVTAEDGDQDGPVNSLKEAMASGIPVIGTFHGGIPELIEDGISGFLVPERDVDAIAVKLSYLIDNSHLWPQMGEAGRKFVEQHYNLNKLNDELVTIYQNLLSEVK